MQSFMGVNEGNGGIIGKLLYYSTSNILIPKNTFVQLGKAFNLPKVKPARESKSSAYRYATTALKERVVTKDLSGTHIYRIYCRDIESYEERIQHFIDNGCDSTAVIERWLKKIEALKLKKATYEQVLKRQLDDLDRDFALLQMQSQELSVRAGKNQIKMPLAA